MDLFSVTVHELGHSLGLMHSNIPDAIMFPYYRGYSKSIKLHGDDIAAIRKLYGDPPSEVLTPAESNSDEITTEIENYPTTEFLTTNIIETTTTTLMPTVTTIETTTITNPITTLALINQAQMHDESTTKNPSRFKTTHQWLKTSYTTTQKIKINYTDRSKLDLCDGFYDAVTMYKGILFIFKGQVSFRF